MHRHAKTTLAIAACLIIGPAFGAQRTFVKTSGVNNPACSLAAPCRDFAAALLATSAGGEVIVLDSGGYGKVTITQSVSIIAPPGVYGGISVFPGDDGVTVAGGGKVTLRGLTINGQGGNRGILITSGAEVYIEQCTIANMGQSGIEIAGGFHAHIRGSVIRSNGQHGLHVTAAAPSTAVVHVVDSQFDRNLARGIFLETATFDATRIGVNYNGGSGLVAEPTGGAVVLATVTDGTISGNGVGGGEGAGAVAKVLVPAFVDMAIVRSTVTRHPFDGIVVLNPVGGGGARALVSESAIVGNKNGVLVGGDAMAAANVTGSTIANNGLYDLSNSALGSILRTSGNNALSRGALSIQGTLTPNPPQ